MKTICIAGKNDIAVDVLLYCKQYYSNCRVVCVTNLSETGINTWQKSVKWFALHNNIEVLNLEDVYGIEDLLFLSCEFDRIIKPEKFMSNSLYNIHFSLLPKYKGCFTSVLPILYGEKYSGVTLHKIRAGIDTGEIIDQKKVLINKTDNSLDLYKKLIKAGTRTIIKNLDKLLDGKVILKQQPRENSEYYSRTYIDYTRLSLDVNKTAYQICNQIKAFAFRPYQFIRWKDTPCIDGKILNSTSSHKPGTILEECESYITIATIDYDCRIYKDTFYLALNLIENGKDASFLCESRKIIEAQNEHGWSLLTVAVYNNNMQMTKWLMNAGANIHVINNNGTTLLMYAKDNYKKTNDSSIFNLLIEKGLSPNIKDYSNRSLIDYCRIEGIDNIGTYRVC